MKKLFLIPLIALLIAGLAIGGCASPEPEPASEATPETTPENEATPDVITLTFAYGAPAPKEGSPFDYQQAMENWAQKIEEETDGRVQIDTYPGGSLLEHADIFQGVTTGIADMGCWFPQYDQSVFVLNGVFLQPGVAWSTPDTRVSIIKEMYSEFPELLAEYEGAKPLFFASMDPSVLCIAKDTVVHTPEDIDGMRIAAAGLSAEALKIVGAVPVSTPAPDRYLSLERGVVDGTEIAWGGVRGYRLYEVCQSFTENVGFGSVFCALVINQQVWDSLPEDIQQVFIDLNDWASEECHRGFATATELAIDLTEEAGRTIYTTTPEELKLWADAMSPMHEVWIEDCESKGLSSAGDIIGEMLRLVDEYNQSQ
jgi:TRAP-type transport system periplasmic protein